MQHFEALCKRSGLIAAADEAVLFVCHVVSHAVPKHI